jgi:2-methylcitrate dehydratase PrpD
MSAAAAGATRQLSEFVAGLRWDDIDGAARHAARRHLIDTAAAAIAGAVQDAPMLVGRALDSADGGGDTPVPGAAERRSLLSAAYLAGTASHGLELDDGYRHGSVHPGACVVPAVLALGSRLQSDGETLLTAIVAGYEVACRVAAAGHPDTRWRGFHNTAIVGPLAAAAAAAKLLGFTASQVENAFGIAVSSSAGLFTFGHGGDVKRTHSGQAARGGLLAALLTKEGLIGPSGAVEMRDGWLHAFAGDAARPVTLLAGGENPASPFAVANCYMKPYAACRHMHSGVDGLLDIMQAEGLSAGDVKALEVGAYALAVEHAPFGWSEMTTAQMSFPFVMATALLRGRVAFEDFGEAGRADAETASWARRIKIELDPECDAIYPKGRPTRVRVTTHDGREFERFVVEPTGAASRPLSDEALDEKFLTLATPVLGARAKAALDVLRADRLADAAVLGDALALSPASV